MKPLTLVLCFVVISASVSAPHGDESEEYSDEDVSEENEIKPGPVRRSNAKETDLLQSIILYFEKTLEDYKELKPASRRYEAHEFPIESYRRRKTSGRKPKPKPKPKPSQKPKPPQKPQNPKPSKVPEKNQNGAAAVATGMITEVGNGVARKVGETIADTVMQAVLPGATEAPDTSDDPDSSEE